MSKSSKLRLAAVIAVASLAVFAVVSAALADSGSGQQNATLRVTASFISSGANPEVARAGDTVLQTFTVTNMSADEKQMIRIFANEDLPAGPKLDMDHLASLQPGKSWSWSVPVLIKSGTAAGVYTLNVAAVSAYTIDPSTASATITIAN